MFVSIQGKLPFNLNFKEEPKPWVEERTGPTLTTAPSLLLNVQNVDKEVMCSKSLPPKSPHSMLSVLLSTVILICGGLDSPHNRVWTNGQHYTGLTLLLPVSLFGTAPYVCMICGRRNRNIHCFPNKINFFEMFDLVFKLDGVAPLIIDPPTISLTPLSKIKK